MFALTLLLGGRHLPVWAGLCALALSGCARRDTAPNGADAQRATGAPRPADTPTAPRAASDGGAPKSAERARALSERRAEREHLVRVIEADGIDDPRTLEALRRVPRHRFVPEDARGAAYANRPLSIGFGQTISQPYIVAAMTAAAAPKPSDRCLEIGTGSGYQAAVLAELCAHTYSIEYLPKVAAFGKQNLHSLGYAVELRTGDGYRGWPEAAPFEVILVTAAPERVPAPLLEQLAVGGRLVIPVGAQNAVQRLELWRRLRPGADASALERTTIADVRFVPFLGDGGK